MSKQIAVIETGSPEYSLRAARVDLAELIGQLQAAQKDGVEHVVFTSGNYRGAKWMHVYPEVDYEDVDDDDDEDEEDDEED